MAHTSPLGKRIVQALEAKGMSRQDLSRATNIPPTTIRHIVVSEHTVRTSEKNIRLIAEALDIPHEELRILAGYEVVPSPTLDEAVQRLTLQLTAYPHLQRAISTLIARGDKADIDEAVSYLEWRQRRKR